MESRVNVFNDYKLRYIQRFHVWNLDDFNYIASSQYLRQYTDPGHLRVFYFY